MSKAKQPEPEEIDIEVCCDGLGDALENGWIQISMQPNGDMVEVIPYNSGKAGVQINFCPFCGEPRSNVE